MVILGADASEEVERGRKVIYIGSHPDAYSSPQINVAGNISWSVVRLQPAV